MYIEKVLKRKDASSVVVAVVVALILSSWMPSTVWELAAKVTGTSNDGGYGSAGNWKTVYLQPFVAMLLQFVVLEVVLRVYVWVHSMVSSK